MLDQFSRYLLFELISLLFVLIRIHEQQPGGCYHNVCAADQYAVIQWETFNKRKAGEGHVDCWRPARVSFCWLIFELSAMKLTIIVIISKHWTVICIDIPSTKQEGSRSWTRWMQGQIIIRHRHLARPTFPLQAHCAQWQYCHSDRS